MRVSMAGEERNAESVVTTTRRGRERERNVVLNLSVAARGSSPRQGREKNSELGQRHMQSHMHRESGTSYVCSTEFRKTDFTGVRPSSWSTASNTSSIGTRLRQVTISSMRSPRYPGRSTPNALPLLLSPMINRLLPPP